MWCLTHHEHMGISGRCCVDRVLWVCQDERLLTRDYLANMSTMTCKDSAKWNSDGCTPYRSDMSQHPRSDLGSAMRSKCSMCNPGPQVADTSQAAGILFQFRDIIYRLMMGRIEPVRYDRLRGLDSSRRPRRVQFGLSPTRQPAGRPEMCMVHEPAVYLSTAPNLVSIAPFALHADACVLEGRSLNYGSLESWDALNRPCI